MRGALIILVLLGVATPVLAQPASESCTVTIARAPDHVRPIVQKWIDAEPCGTSLEVRIVPTQGGFYLLAREADGDVRERIVPNAESAGVLIASWMAIDAEHAAPGAMAVELSYQPPAPAPVLAPPAATKPTFAVLSEARTDVRARADAEPPRTRSRTVYLAGTVARDALGLRVALDLAQRRGWRFGLATGLSSASFDVHAWRAAGFMDTVDLKGIGYLGYSADLGANRLVVTTGLGFIRTWGTGTLFDTTTGYATYWPQTTAFTSTLEASVAYARVLSPQLSAHIGPIATVYAQDLDLRMGEQLLPNTDAHSRRYVEVGVAVGIGYRM